MRINQIPLFVALFYASALAHAAVATFIAPDGSVVCTLGSVQVNAAGNATMTVTGCKAFDCEIQPPQPPPVVTGDPGSGVWAPNNKTTIFDLSKTSNRTFVPGCIDGQSWNTTNCEYQSGLVAGHIYGARTRVGVNGNKLLKIERAETGEASSSVHGVVSQEPGAVVTSNPKCAFTSSSQSIEIQDSVWAANSQIDIGGVVYDFSTCVMPANAPLYLNFTPDDGRCGNSIECRVQVIER